MNAKATPKNKRYDFSPLLIVEITAVIAVIYECRLSRDENKPWIKSILELNPACVGRRIAAGSRATWVQPAEKMIGRRLTRFRERSEISWRNYRPTARISRHELKTICTFKEIENDFPNPDPQGPHHRATPKRTTMVEFCFGTSEA